MSKLGRFKTATGIVLFLAGFMGVSVVLCLCAVTVNYLMPPVLIAILCALIFECVGAFFLWGRRVAAAFEIIIVLSSFYAVIVMTLKVSHRDEVLQRDHHRPHQFLCRHNDDAEDEPPL